MEDNRKLYSFTRIGRSGAIALLKDRGYESRLTFDPVKRKVVLDGIPDLYEPKLFHGDFCTANGYEIHPADLHNALYYLARKNDPTPLISLEQGEEDSLKNLLEALIKEQQPKQIFLKEVATSLQKQFPQYTPKSLEIRLSKALKGLGWKKKVSNSRNFWVKGENV